MKEIGSDYHYIKNYKDTEGQGLFDYYSLDSVSLYATGRHALCDLLLLHPMWKRIWVPEYFCYDVIEAIEKTGLSVAFYNDNPISKDDKNILQINQSFKSGDVLLRMNYFGLRGFRSNKHISIPVIEDHSHDLLGEWALKSDADWCVASLRKTLPIAEGGMLWSPAKHQLPVIKKSSAENDLIVKERWKAMELKLKYLSNTFFDKEEFRKMFLETESSFNYLPLSGIANSCIGYLLNFNIKEWYSIKGRNWKKLSSMFDKNFTHSMYLHPENTYCNPFSFIMLCSTKEKRERIRFKLIKMDIYPAILWQIPVECPSKYVSERLLSVHCDARYDFTSSILSSIRARFDKI